MATKMNLMGLGLPAPLANRMADASDGAILVTAIGASQASAYQIGGAQALVIVQGSSTGLGVSLPAVGGDNGALLGDDFTISNIYGGSVIVYAPGSAVIYQGGVSTSGATGVSVSLAKLGTFYPVTPSVWIGQVN